jgi:hypothetical protein
LHGSRRRAGRVKEEGEAGGWRRTVKEEELRREGSRHALDEDRALE